MLGGVARPNRFKPWQRWTRRLPPWARRWGGRALLAALAGLLVVNGAIRLAGGDAWPFSVRFLPEKITALALSVRHVVSGDGDAGAEQAAAHVRAAARRHGVPEPFALAVATVESGLRPSVISACGAMGLMQLMPATARGLGVGDPFDARDNAEGGVRYLRQLWRRYGGDRRRVAAAYNAGPGAVPRAGPIPAGARAYAERVLRATAARPRRPSTPKTAGPATAR
jgi:soluble lytic murein transglycosylase-like protein